MTVYFVGLDGATFDLIKPLVKKGKLPNFKRIMSAGSFGILESEKPPSTFPGWPTIATGKNPGKHGIYNFFDPKKRKPLLNQKITIVDSSYLSLKTWDANPFWSLLSSEEKRVAVINYPGTYPPRKINGVMVTGMLTPTLIKKQFTYPESFASTLKQVVPDYEIDAKFQVDRKNALKNVNLSAEKRMRLAEYLIKKEPFDLFAIIFTGLDRIQHYLWNSAELNKHYQKLDDFLGQFLRLMKKKDYLFILSDHGFQEAKTYFNINNWLIENGYLYVRDSKSMSYTFLKFFGLKKSNILKLMKLLRLTKLLKYAPMKIKGLFVNNNPSFEDMDVDWEKTLAYAPFITENGLYLNVSGREPKGIVTDKNYHGVRDRIIAGLKKEKINISAYKREEIYSGPYTKQFPDIVLNIEDKGYRINTGISSKVYEDINHLKEEEPLARHHKDGILLVFGPDIKKQELKNRMKQIDILPTILHILDLSIPKDIDGTVIKNLFDKNSLLHKKEICIKKDFSEKSSISNAISILDF